ncbi:hypothetical protein FPV67DRAFT_1450163 [Lyophyllum atratum]|nr:hypothetical protein FPV67DRAFT_1450160 [Lyophyllum atratum]KAF8067067.1 hypothetical protein FPV67DRAFT_1450163 [Lyophyllum atratum]
MFVTFYASSREVSASENAQDERNRRKLTKLCSISLTWYDEPESGPRHSIDVTQRVNPCSGEVWASENAVCDVNGRWTHEDRAASPQVRRNVFIIFAPPPKKVLASVNAPDEETFGENSRDKATSPRCTTKQNGASCTQTKMMTSVGRASGSNARLPDVILEEASTTRGDLAGSRDATDEYGVDGAREEGGDSVSGYEQAPVDVELEKKYLLSNSEGRRRGSRTYYMHPSTSLDPPMFVKPGEDGSRSQKQHGPSHIPTYHSRDLDARVPPVLIEVRWPVSWILTKLRYSSWPLGLELQLRKNDRFRSQKEGL